MTDRDPPSGPAPLDGLTVVDLGQVLATPFATHLLGMLGAEIVKVEPPAGDWLRNGTELGFATQNAGKRSVVVDLWAAGGAEVVLRLVEGADVFVEGFAPGTAEAMGLGWETVSARNPRVVYGSLSAFGDVGPYGGRAGFDHVVQAISGIMPATGFPDQPPTKVGAPFLDYGGGLLLAYGILAGILEQRRVERAVRLDVAMLDAGLLFNAGALTRAAGLGADPPRTGNDAFSGAVASGAFETADGLLMLAANKARHFDRLAGALGLDDLIGEIGPSGRDVEPDRVAGIRARIAERLLTEPAQWWEEELNRIGVPAGRVRSLTEVVGDGHPTDRGLLQRAGPDDPLVPGAGVRIDGVMPGARGPAPGLGRDGEEILARFGFTSDEVADLRDRGVVGPG